MKTLFHLYRKTGRMMLSGKCTVLFRLSCSKIFQSKFLYEYSINSIAKTVLKAFLMYLELQRMKCINPMYLLNVGTLSKFYKCFALKNSVYAPGNLRSRNIGFIIVVVEGKEILDTIKYI